MLPQRHKTHICRGEIFADEHTIRCVHSENLTPAGFLVTWLLLRFNGGRIYTAHVHFLQRDQAVAGY